MLAATNDGPRPAFMVVELSARTLQIRMVIQQLQSSQNLLGTAANESHDLRGTEKTMPVHKPDDFAVALRQFHGSDLSRTFEAGKTWRLHRSTVSESERAKKSSRFALGGQGCGGLSVTVRRSRVAPAARRGVSRVERTGRV